MSARSDDCWMGTLMVALLFAGTGSVSLALTLATLVTVPRAVGVRMMVTVAVAPLARLPIAQLMAAVQVPWLGFALTKVVLAGSGFDKITPVAGEGPLFTMVTVKVSG